MASPTPSYAPEVSRIPQLARSTSLQVCPGMVFQCLQCLSLPFHDQMGCMHLLSSHLLHSCTSPRLSLAVSGQLLLPPEYLSAGRCMVVVKVNNAGCESEQTSALFYCMCYLQLSTTAAQIKNSRAFWASDDVVSGHPKGSSELSAKSTVGCQCQTLLCWTSSIMHERFQRLVDSTGQRLLPIQ